MLGWGHVSEKVKISKSESSAERMSSSFAMLCTLLSVTCERMCTEYWLTA